jgi:hypothetical protein
VLFDDSKFKLPVETIEKINRNRILDDMYFPITRELSADRRFGNGEGTHTNRILPMTLAHED